MTAVWSEGTIVVSIFFDVLSKHTSIFYAFISQQITVILKNMKEREQAEKKISILTIILIIISNVP